MEERKKKRARYLSAEGWALGSTIQHRPRRTGKDQI